ncbi:MAG TPA: preprotein translocase subunit YajC [Pseudonocardiaceae bacterium]|jgi:preprotein translocase subunit YajC|nr:preprotein translocase subunit YajC [Pseudonocardiaceae bacterium]
MSFSSLLLPLIIVLFAVPLFMGTRKQKRAQQQQQEMQNSLSYGDRVMTTSGLFGSVVSTSDDSIDIEIAPGVVTSWLRAAVREKVADSTVGQPDEVEDLHDESVTPSAQTEDTVEDSVPESESKAEIAPPLEESSKKAR